MPVGVVFRSLRWLTMSLYHLDVLRARGSRRVCRMLRNVFADSLESEEARSGVGCPRSGGIQLEDHQYVSCSLVSLWVIKRRNPMTNIAKRSVLTRRSIFWELKQGLSAFGDWCRSARNAVKFWCCGQSGCSDVARRGSAQRPAEHAAKERK